MDALRQHESRTRPARRSPAAAHRRRQARAAAGSPGAPSRLLSGWRSLLRFWLAVLAAGAVGGAVLQNLGPLQEGAVREPSPGPQGGAGRTVPAPPAAPVASQAQPLPDRVLPQGPPNVRAAPETATPAVADPASGPSRDGVLVVFRIPRSEESRAAAQQLAARAGLASGQVATEMASDPPARATIRFYAAADHALARRLGRELTGLGVPWQIENLSGRTPPFGRPTVEVWLPAR